MIPASMTRLSRCEVPKEAGDEEFVPVLHVQRARVSYRRMLAAPESSSCPTGRRETSCSESAVRRMRFSSSVPSGWLRRTRQLSVPVAGRSSCLSSRSA